MPIEGNERLGELPSGNCRFSDNLLLQLYLPERGPLPHVVVGRTVRAARRGGIITRRIDHEPAVLSHLWPMGGADPVVDCPGRWMGLWHPRFSCRRSPRPRIRTPRRTLVLPPEAGKDCRSSDLGPLQPAAWDLRYATSRPRIAPLCRCPTRTFAIHSLWWPHNKSDKASWPMSSGVCVTL